MPTGRCRPGKPPRWWRPLIGQKRYAEAEPLLLAGRQHLTEIKEAPPGKVGGATTALVELYEAWGNADEAAAWRGKVVP